MALTDENGGGIGATMLVGPANVGGGYGYPYPVYQNMGGGNSNSGWGGDWGWIILLLLLAGNGGWGMGGGFGFGGGLGYDFPWLLNGQQGINNNVSSGFRDAQLSNAVTSVRDGIAGLSTQLCNSCADMAQTVNGGFANAETAANARQMANMQQAFAAQTAMAQGFNQLGSQFADCCCENRLATNDLKYTIATENCADRAAISDGIRDILAAQTAGTQRILDKLCQDKIDEKNDTIAQLRQEVLYARGQASQDVQTARLLAGQTSEVDALYNRLSQCPVPCMPVYGMTPIFTCNNGNNGCGCNGGNF